MALKFNYFYVDLAIYKIEKNEDVHRSTCPIYTCGLPIRRA